MTKDDTLWLAGLLEGEGAFDLHKGKYPRVRVGMTDRDVVGRVATLFGCKVRLSLKPAPNSAMWHAEITGARAVTIMEAVLPHMGSRRSGKIATVLGNARLPRGVSGAPGVRIVRPPALPDVGLTHVPDRVNS